MPWSGYDLVFTYMIYVSWLWEILCGLFRLKDQSVPTSPVPCQTVERADLSELS